MGRGLALEHGWLKVRALPYITSLCRIHLLIPKERQVPRKEPRARGPMAMPVQEPSLTSPGGHGQGTDLGFLIFKMEPQSLLPQRCATCVQHR